MILALVAAIGKVIDQMDYLKLVLVIGGALALAWILKSK